MLTVGEKTKEHPLRIYDCGLADYREALQQQLLRAQRDAEKVIQYITKNHKLSRIYQWGSLVHTERFSELSDIDIAVEGLAEDEGALSSIREAAEALAELTVDLVALERVEPGRAELIRRFGRIAWEPKPDA